MKIIVSHIQIRWTVPQIFCFLKLNIEMYQTWQRSMFSKVQVSILDFMVNPIISSNWVWNLRLRMECCILGFVLPTAEGYMND